MTIKTLWKEIKGDLPQNRKFSVFLFLKCYLYDLSFRLLLNHRIGKYHAKKKNKLSNWLAIYYKNKQYKKRNCQISTDAVIGKGVFFSHPLGVVIGDNVEIKDNVKIWQQVTLGSHGKKGEKLNYPVVGKNVKIFAGAKVFGGIVIGENAVIGANAVVNIDVPENGVAVGIPAKIIQK